MYTCGEERRDGKINGGKSLQLCLFSFGIDRNKLAQKGELDLRELGAVYCCVSIFVGRAWLVATSALA